MGCVLVPMRVVEFIGLERRGISVYISLCLCHLDGVLYVACVQCDRIGCLDYTLIGYLDFNKEIMVLKRVCCGCCSMFEYIGFNKEIMA